MTLIDWDLEGVYPNNYEDISLSFYGKRGVIPNGYSPYPSGTIRADTTAVTTPGTCNMVCYAINTYRYTWETSRDGTNWTELEEQTNELTVYYQHKAGVGGDHYYRCICKGYMGEYTTDPIKITVSYHAPVIDIYADKTAVTAPGTIEFTAEAEYTVSYQWYKDGTAITGAINPTFNAIYSYGDGGTFAYTCKATGLGGETVSSPITVTITEPLPTITISPETVTVVQGETATITATAAYTESYLWYKQSGGLLVECGTGSSYTTEASDIPAVEKYCCKATGKGGSTMSKMATVTTEAAQPTVSISADKTEIKVNETVTFTATYSPATVTLSFQQLMNEEWTELATTPAVQVTITDAGIGKFRFVADNYGKQAVSDTVEITVTEE